MNAEPWEWTNSGSIAVRFNGWDSFWSFWKKFSECVDGCEILHQLVDGKHICKHIVNIFPIWLYSHYRCFIGIPVPTQELPLGGSVYGSDCMVVCNDWHSALVPMLIHAEKSTTGAPEGWELSQNSEKPEVKMSTFSEHFWRFNWWFFGMEVWPPLAITWPWKIPGLDLILLSIMGVLMQRGWRFDHIWPPIFNEKKS